MRLGFCTKIKTNFWVFSSNGGVFSVCGFGHSALQSFKCVWSVDMCAYIKLTFRLHQARHIPSSLHSGVVLS